MTSPDLKINENKNHRRLNHIVGDKAELTVLKNKKRMYSISLKPTETRLTAEIKRFKKNEDKISFGIVKTGYSRLEFCAYKRVLQTVKDSGIIEPLFEENKTKNNSIKKLNPYEYFIFLNGEYIKLDIDDWKKLFRISNKIGHFLGLLGRKKVKKSSKK